MARGDCPECSSKRIRWYKSKGKTKFWLCRSCGARWQTNPDWK